MLHWKRYFLALLIAISLQACESLPHLEGFDQVAWKDDPNACKGKRQALLESLVSHKDKLEGLGQNQILKILGKPDIQELYARNQRFYIYFYLQGPHCKKAEADINQGGLVRIRFNALDQMTELYVQK